MSLAPVVLFVYSRIDHTARTIDALKRNTLSNQTDLLIYSDAAKSSAQHEAVEMVRAFIRGVQGFKSVCIVERESNFGLAASIIDGVTEVVAKYGKIIVLEDDMVTSPYFLQYMNDGLDKYASNQDVASIHAYVYPIPGLPDTFFLRGADCWGWATWADRWAWFEPDGSKLLQQLTERDLLQKFDFNSSYAFSEMLRAQIAGRNNSWAIRWHASTFLLNKLTLYPGKSLLMNIGNDGSGVHCGKTESYAAELINAPMPLKAIAFTENTLAYNAFENFFRKNKVSIFNSILARFTRFFN